MKLSRQHGNTSVGFNMTPMIDVVFLLIIFFMTVSQITRVVDHPLELPRVTGGKSNERAELTINLTNEGAILVAEQEYSLGQLVVLANEMIQQAGGRPADLRVRLRCDRQRKADIANQILRELSEMGVVQVRVGVQRSETD